MRGRGGAGWHSTHSFSTSDSFFGFASGCPFPAGAGGLPAAGSGFAFSLPPGAAPFAAGARAFVGSGGGAQCAGGVSEACGLRAEQHMLPIASSPVMGAQRGPPVHVTLASLCRKPHLFDFVGIQLSTNLNKRPANGLGLGQCGLGPGGGTGGSARGAAGTMADLEIPNAVMLLQAKIDQHNAMGQRFPDRPADAARGKETQRGGVRASTDEFFRSARRAPSEQVRLSVRAHPSQSHRNDLPLELRDEKPDVGSPPKGGAKSPNRSLDGGASGMPSVAGGKAGAAGKDESNRFRMGVPQRVEPPKDLNTPVRAEDGTMVSPAEGEGSAAAENPSVSRRQASVTKLKDQEILA